MCAPFLPPEVRFQWKLRVLRICGTTEYKQQEENHSSGYPLLRL